MKKLINRLDDIVPEMLDGLVAFNPGLTVLDGYPVVVRRDAGIGAAEGNVAIVSGGGAGHEPAHAGYVGAGMLTAAVVGEVFTSPSVDAVLDAIRAVAGPAGVLLIVKSYTGDRLNFGLAAELARADGIAVEVVIVADDVALAAAGAHAGRRGIAGTVLVHKIAGAAAAEGRSLVEVADAARAAAASMGTMGVSLGACIVPAAGEPSFELAADEIEWGLGIHGEAGVERGPVQTADAIVERLLEAIIADLELTAGDSVALLVNNLGGTSVSELGIVARSALRYLETRGVVVARGWTGTFLTALEMPGCSLTLLEVDDERIVRLDAPTATSAWPAGLGVISAGRPDVVKAAADGPEVETSESARAGTPLAANSVLRLVIERVCAVLLDSAQLLTEMDQKVGDGDLGISLARGTRAVLAELDTYPAEVPVADVLRRMAATVRRVVGGTSGPLYAVLLLRAAAALDRDPSDWTAAFAAAVDGVVELGGAEPGDRTMVDALRPAADALGADGGTLDAAVAAAERGAAGTASMRARLGRSSYLGDRVLGDVDPGAHAVALWLGAIRDALS